LLVYSCAAIAADDPAVVLARTLAGRGVLDAGNVLQVVKAADGKRTETLAALLVSKGILKEADLATSPESAPKPAMLVAAPQNPPAPKPSVSLYGTVMLNAFYNTAGANIQDIPLFLAKQGSDTTGSDKNFGMTARQSRLGVRVQGITVGSAAVSGVVEADFLGGKTALPNGENMDLPRMSLAYARLDWKKFAVEAGEDWSIFAPLNPVTVAEFAIPGLSASGNAWIRTPQVRAEYRTTHILWQVAATDPNMGDYTTSSFATARVPGIGERGRMPAIDSRVALSKSKFTVGASSHYGRGKNAGTGVDSWGAAVDYILPLAPHFTLTGEAFTGRALGIFSAAAGEAVGAVGTAGEHGVATRGGWVQAQFALARRWQANLGYGGEAMKAAQLPVGNRYRNQTYSGNIIFRPTPALSWAWEYRRILTDFRAQSAAGERGDHVNMAIGYTF
jgi:hypothetical protein